MDEWTRIAILGECNGEIFECVVAGVARGNVAKRESPRSLFLSVCENFSHRFIRASSFVRFLYGLALLSSSGGGREHLLLSHSLYRSRSCSPSLTDTHTHILSLVARIANLSEAVQASIDIYEYVQSTSKSYPFTSFLAAGLLLDKSLLFVTRRMSN